MQTQNTSAGEKHKKALRIVFAITATYLVIEVVVGYLSNSLALLSDAAHMLTDVGGQALALFAIWMSSKPRNEKRTYGYYRIEIFSALTNALVLIFISGFILYEAWQRFENPPPVAGKSMLIVAFFGLIINLIAMRILKKGSDESINIKGAFLEVVSDMLSSIAVIIAGIIIIATGWLYIDPIVSAVIGLFILPRTYNLLKESVDILLEAVPKGLDYQKVEKTFAQHPDILSIHDLHIWTITSGMLALSVHVIPKKDLGLTAFDNLISEIKSKLENEFQITHSTIEVHFDKTNYKQNAV